MGEGGRRERGKREGKKGEGVKWGGEGGREDETLLCACTFRHVTRAGISRPPPYLPWSIYVILLLYSIF